MSNTKKLYRDVDNEKVAGVCAGLADYLDLDVTLIRVIWLILILCAGTGLLAYIIMAIVVEPKDKVLKDMRRESLNKDNNDEDDPFAKYD